MLDTGIIALSDFPDGEEAEGRWSQRLWSIDSTSSAFPDDEGTEGPSGTAVSSTMLSDFPADGGLKEVDSRGDLLQFHVDGEATSPMTRGLKQWSMSVGH